MKMTVNQKLKMVNFVFNISFCKYFILYLQINSDMSHTVLSQKIWKIQNTNNDDVKKFVDDSDDALDMVIGRWVRQCWRKCFRRWDETDKKDTE